MVYFYRVFFFNFCFFLFFFWLGPRFRFTASGDKSASEKCRRKKKVAFFWHPTCQKAKKKTWVKGMFFFFFLLVGDKNKFANRQIRTHAQQDNLSAEFLFSTFLFFGLLFFAFLEQIQSFLNAIVSFSFFFLKVWQLCTGFGRLWTDLQPVLQFSCATKFYRVLLGFIGFERGLTGWTGFYWVLLGFFSKLKWGLIRFLQSLAGFNGFWYGLIDQRLIW